MIFNMSTSYFHKKFISLFWGLFNDETDLRVRYSIFWWTVWRISLPNSGKKRTKNNCSRKTDTHTWAQVTATTLCLEIMCPSFEHGMTLIHGRSITHLSNNNRPFIVLENITEINSHSHPKLQTLKHRN